jgi:hypothetical protein
VVFSSHPAGVQRGKSVSTLRYGISLDCDEPYHLLAKIQTATLRPRVVAGHLPITEHGVTRRAFAQGS